MAEIIGVTESVCPECLRRIAARRVARADGVYLEKTCPEHGDFSTLIWRGDAESYHCWGAHQQPSADGPAACQREVTAAGCPYDCGLCGAHQQQMCCVLLEVTNRCDLQCPVCFASSGAGGPDPTLTEIGRWFEELLAAGGPFNIQLSGGEPTMRDDLPEIIALGKQKGFTFFQLNTNGLRLARDEAYAQRLAQAGLNTVFLQFDGVTDAPYAVLRGRPLLAEKQRAISVCAGVGLGVVLVPTIAAGVNDSEIGAILDFALKQLPMVRGVHFQPMSFFGRCALAEEARRWTLPDMLAAIERQSGGRMQAAHFTGGSAENAYCSFHANFMLQPDGNLKPLAQQPSCCQMPTSERSRLAVASRWSAPKEAACCPPAQPADAFDVFLHRFSHYTLAVSGMLFQDAWSFDLERVKRCYIGEVDGQGGRIVPFCAYNLTAADGRSLYRGRS